MMKRKSSKYNEYRAKARKWDELVEFLRGDNHITNIIPITPHSTLRMSKDGKLYKREQRKILASLDIIGQPL